MPRFSIIVPVYNVEAYVSQCLDSIRFQTFDDFEIICVIDGSRDRSEAIVSMHAQADDRISVIKKENGGLSSARNAGIQAATGDYLFFVDADDMLNQKAVATVDRALCERPADVVTFGGELCPGLYEGTWLEKTLSPEYAWYERFEPKMVFEDESHPYVWRTVVRRELLEETGLLFDETLTFGEDQVFHFQLYPRAKGVLIIPDKLYRYRVMRRESLMATRSADAVLRVSEHIELVCRILEDWYEQGLLAKYRKEMTEFVVEFLQDDVVCYGTEENGLLVRYAALFDDKYLDVTSLIDNAENSLAKAMAGYLALLPEGFQSDEYRNLRNEYLEKRCIGLYSVKERPKWQNKLRLVLPMSALALEERLDVVRMQTNAEYIQWCAEDAATCTRSLELLRAELNWKL